MSLGLLSWFVIGLLLGWVIEWLIDHSVWRPRLRKLEQTARREAESADRLRAALAEARGSLAALDADLRTARADAAADLARLGGDLEQARAAQAEQEQRAAELVARGREEAGRIAGQLGERDAQLAELAARLVEREAQLAEQAAELAERDAQLVDHAAQLAEQAAELAERDAQIGRLRQREAEFRRAVETLRDVLARTRHELRQERALKLAAVLPGGDPLIDIDGIGPVYQQRLYDAGVNSFARLATLTPQEVRAIIAPQPWQELNPTPWIAEAARRAGHVRRDRDPLADITGIGPAYERRLYEAGVNTFAELAVLTPDHLRALFRPQERAQVDAEAWIAEARELAIQVRAGTYRKGVA